MKKSRSDRLPLRRLVGVCALLVAQGAAAFTISNNPPFLPTPLAPNIVITFDDSGSMRWAYAPDQLCADHSTRRAKSSDYNPIYYNPRSRYDPPVNYNAASGTYTTYSTSFKTAYINGFETSRGSVDLSVNYQVTWAYDPSSSNLLDTSRTVSPYPAGFNFCGSNATRNNLASNPDADFNTAAGGDRRYVGVPAYYYVYDPAGTACASAALTNDACYALRVVGDQAGPADMDGNGVVDGDDERQNFANWYSFYRTRNLMTATAATRAMVGVPTTARVAWQSLNSCNATTSSGTTAGRLFTSACQGWTAAGVTSNSVDKRIRVLDGAHRANFYHWMSRMPASGSTPLRGAAQRAGDYFRTNGVSSPYAQDPQVSVGTEFSCRPNFHILMTDGIWNDGAGNYCSGGSCGNKDGTATTLPDGTAYSVTDAKTAIYRDGNSDSVADIAFHYWATDLRSDLANNLIPYRVDRNGTADQQYWNPKNDPAIWQHLVTFTVGLGLSKTLSEPGIEWAGSTYAGTGYQNLLSGTNTWPTTGADLSPGNVYDLWHAAINSRGQSFSADTPRALADALATALNRILERESAAAALAT
ncbi:MAG: hypothetical protein L6Q72_15270, partial [Burkholderiaceae bacterium]|nr:hypothetical protein [Burkholderiaceae bacterium]